MLSLQPAARSASIPKPTAELLPQLYNGPASRFCPPLHMGPQLHTQLWMY